MESSSAVAEYNALIHAMQDWPVFGRLAEKNICSASTRCRHSRTHKEGS